MANSARLARLGFVDSASAVRLLGPAPDGIGLWDSEQNRSVDPASDDLVRALGASADPQLALRQLRAAVAAGGADLIDQLRTGAVLRDRAAALLGASQALGDDLVLYPSHWSALSTLDDELLTKVSAAADPAELRLAYRAALLRIAADDLSGQVGLDRTTLSLSTLADVTLSAALTMASADREPVNLAVVAMGKCGGRELNYVSDVDVIFVCASDRDLAGATAVAAQLMQICAGAAWPVDANLRPEGSRGPLVRTLASHLAYYEKWAHLWEFQALLKARPVAGDLELGQGWLDGVRPHVWRAVERPNAVAEVRQMRARIIANVAPQERDREIKRGPGGLRDVEFAVQLLQLVHGRADLSLRSTSTLETLAALTAGGYVGRADGQALATAYRFLRTVEHRLQLQRLRRTHTVPDERRAGGAIAFGWLARAVGFAGLSAADDFRAAWQRQAQEVRRLHAKLVYRPLVEAVARVPSESLRLSPAAAGERMEILGFRDPAGALRHLQSMTSGVSRNAAIQNTLLPVLLPEFADAVDPDRGLLAYRQVSEALRATPWFLRLLRDEGPVALRLARLLGLSRYITDLLVRDPEALRLLADDAQLRPRPAQTLLEGALAAVGRHADAGSAVLAVRALRRRELFRIAAADLLAATNALPGGALGAAEVGQALADITDVTLAAALQAVRPLAARLRFAIIGMGRLGSAEPSYGSDADVLFVYEAPPGMSDAVAAAGAATVAEELRRQLSMPAPEPALGVDANLRPEGRQGPLVRSLAAYERYYAQRASIWEAQALLRARPVAGDADLAARFIDAVAGVRYPVDGIGLAAVQEIRRIKARVDSERLPRGADPATHTKLGRGGLADVEWAVQLVQLRHAGQVVDLRTPSTLGALAAAGAAGLISAADCAALAEGWALATRVRNALMLVRGRPSDQLPRQGDELAGVARALGRSGEAQAFLDEYLRTARRARAAAERVFLS